MRFNVVVSKGCDHGYCVSVPALPGCHSHGETIEEALEHIKEAIELYIEDMEPDEIAKATNAATPQIHEVAVQ